MELNSDLITVQGLLKSLEKSTGDFWKIKYKSGNENKISLIIKEINDFLAIKNYLINREINPQFMKQIEDIVLFLTLNSEFKNDSIYELKEYVHLIGICPRLSQCILLNIIIELNLADSYCSAMKKLPSEHIESLIKEIIPNIKKLQPQQILENSFIFLKHFHSILSSNNDDVTNEITENIMDVASELLLILTGINPEHMNNLKKIEIYKHIGITLLKLLELLDYCEGNHKVNKFFESVINTTCIIMKSVTINIYCAWSEVKYEGEPLQMTIGEKAYSIIEKYQKLNSANELIQMLVTIAKKPKSLNEMIQAADNNMMISKIYKADIHQKHWLNALLNTQIFNDKKSMNCVEEWSHLCDLDNVDRILDLTTFNKNEKAKKLALQCAHNLCPSELIVATVRFYYKHGLHNALQKDISTELTVLLNKANGKDENVEDFLKQLVLLILQNPHQVVEIMLRECIKSNVYCLFLKNIFENLKELFQIEQLLLQSMKLLMENIPPNEENVVNYRILLDTLFEVECFKWDKCLDVLFVPYLEKCEDDLESLLYIFSILAGIKCKLPYHLTLTHLFDIVLKTLDKARINFFHFSNVKCSLTKELITFLKNNKQYINKDELLTLTVDNFVNKYYLNWCKTQEEIEFIDYFFPNLNVQEEADCTSKILKVIPSCIQEEWISIFQQIAFCNNNVTVLQLLTNVILLLSQVAKTQKETTINNVMIAMKYYLTCYAAVIQGVLHLDETNNQIELCMNICRVIRELPVEIKEEEGLKLVPLLPQEALNQLREDKSFLCLLVSLENKNISQIIARKIMEQI